MTRFGIGEWFGRSFVKLTDEERRAFAVQATRAASTNPDCPFQAGGRRCNKKGGVCSFRLYEQSDDDDLIGVPVGGPNGSLRTLCPNRFKQAGTIFSHIGKVMLGTDSPLVATEVRFLQRPSSGPAADAAEEESDEDVGNIDMVLVHPTAVPLQWCALEIQAVYFSGKGMGTMFEHIRTFPAGIPYPDKVRRPDYRSSGPKRLMPQLQIKVPTLRRWGKKMAVVVDDAWFRANVVNVETVKDLSNCDIAWFVVSFDESTDPATLTVGEPEKQTLERAVEGLTGGFPVTLTEFESKIQEKLRRRRRR